MNNWTFQTGWSLVTEPTEAALDLEAAKSHLRIDTDKEDNDVERMVKAATEWVESRGEMLSPQTWDLTLDVFPINCPIQILKRPLRSVEYITYVDQDGATQTWDSSKYKVAKKGRWPRIAPAFNEMWPITRSEMEAVTIRLNLGYDSSPRTIPAAAQQAMLLLIGHLYENREAVVVIQGIVSLELPLGLEALLDQVIGGARIY